MNRNSIARIFILASVCTIAVPAAEIQASSRVATASVAAATGHPSARLIVQRTPNFGADLVVRLSIDGRKVADIPRNQHYGDFVSKGRHVLTVLALPNTPSRRPTSISMTVRSGHLYIFTVGWEADRIFLRPSTYYSPTTRAN